MPRGFVFWGNVPAAGGATATLSVTEVDDVLSAASLVDVSATFSSIENSDSLASTGEVSGIIPELRSEATSTEASLTTSHTIDLPADIQAGDLILVIVSFYASFTITWDNTSHGTWIDLGTYGGLVQGAAYRYKIADGTEAGGSLTITTAASSSSVARAIAYSKTGEIDISTSNAGTDSTAELAAAADSWGNVGRRTLATLSHVNGWVNVWPTGFTENQYYESPNVGSPDSAAPRLAIIDRVAVEGSQDPDLYELNTSAIWRTATISLRGSLVAVTSVAEQADTLNATGEITTGDITGTASIVELDDQSLISGSVAISATVSITEQDDVGLSAVTILISGAADLDEESDLVTSTTSVAIAAAAALQEQDDSLTSSISGAVTASAMITEADDLSASAVAVSIVGAATLQEVGDVLSAAASSGIIAAATVQEAADSVSASGIVVTTGTVVVTEQDDLGSATVTVLVTATASIQEQDDLLAASVAGAVSASASIIERGDIVVADGTVLVLGSLAITEAEDGLSASASVLAAIDATASLQEQDDRLTATVVERVARYLAISDGKAGRGSATDGLVGRANAADQNVGRVNVSDAL